MIKKDKKKSDYLTIKESREIIKYNIKQMKYYEAMKRRKLDESEYTLEMNDENNIIELDDLHTSFFTDRGTVKSVDGVSFSIPKNKILGVVGESGCGKSVTSLSIMQLVQAPQGQVTGGKIRFNSDALGYSENGKKLGYDIAKMPTEVMHKIRGKDITMIFQEPMTSLNPVFTIGYQLDEVSFLHTPEKTKEEVKAYSIDMLNKVGISMPERVYDSYPHELSGGMRHDRYGACGQPETDHRRRADYRARRYYSGSDTRTFERFTAQSGLFYHAYHPRPRRYRRNG